MTKVQVTYNGFPYCICTYAEYQAHFADDHGRFSFDYLPGAQK